MHNGRIFEGLITSAAEDGSGVARCDGYTVFVKDACIGDKCLIEITKANKNYGFGRIKELICPSPDRVAPVCAFFPECGGCTLLHTDYRAQLALKRETVKNALIRLGGFEGVFVHDVISSDPCFNYRNKSQYPVSGTPSHVKIGFYKAKSHDVIDISDCAIENPDARKVISEVKMWMEQYKIAPYDEKSNKGQVRHVYFRAAKTSVVVIVAREREIPHLPELRDLLLSLPLSAPLSGIVVNINPGKTNTILGESDFVLFGERTIKAQIGDICYNVNYRSFFQVNSFTTLLLYQKAAELASLTGRETVFDLYCGIGTISLYLARMAKKVIGVEIVPEAVKDAKENAKLNNIENAVFYEGAAEKVCPKLIENGEKADVVVVDPPRKGCDEKLLDAIGEMSPEKVVYVSCNVSTMARDARFLCEKYGYELRDAYPVDQFPHTMHVETVCQLVLRRSPVHINIDVDVEELVQDKRGMATYEQIKAYVLEHSGLKVSNLYIAQVKQKCGIIERENYNKPKSEDAKQPQCPPEKEVAIRNALEHFRMI